MIFSDLKFTVANEQREYKEVWARRYLNGQTSLSTIRQDSVFLVTERLELFMDVLNGNS